MVGAFGNKDETAADEPVLYIDRTGSTHAELKEDGVIKRHVVLEGHRKGTILATSPAALMNVQPPDETTLKLHSREVATLQQKPIVARWGKSACGKQAAKARAASKVTYIQQPKRGL